MVSCLVALDPTVSSPLLFEWFCLGGRGEKVGWGEGGGVERGISE